MIGDDTGPSTIIGGEAGIPYGGSVAKKPQKVFWGGYSGYFQDIDGYYWDVA